MIVFVGSRACGISMHSHYSIIIIYYARSALKQLLNFHSQRHRFRRRGRRHRRCHLPLVKRDCRFAVPMKPQLHIVYMANNFDFIRIYFWHYHELFFRRFLLILKVHESLCSAHTRRAWKTVVGGSNFNDSFLRHFTWACTENIRLHSPCKSSRPNRMRSISLQRTIIKKMRARFWMGKNRYIKM